jgi:hypothetical protein
MRFIPNEKGLNWINHPDKEILPESAREILLVTGCFYWILNLTLHNN